MGRANRLFVMALVLAGACGGSQAGGETPATTDCAAVAAHLSRLAMLDNEATERPTDLDGAEKELERQCTSSPWSERRKSCLVAAKSQEATLQCPRQ